MEEIYGIRTSGKYGTLKQSYHEFYRIYGQNVLRQNVKPESIITEDSHSVFQFFQSVCNDYGLTCDSAKGKSNLFHDLKYRNKEEKILVVADGAAFGAEIDRILFLLRERPNITLYLPESFEWLILSSNIFKDKEIEDILSNPSDFIESKSYMSWERFFTAILIQKTKGTFLAYTKKELNRSYLEEHIKTAVLNQIEKIEFCSNSR